MCKHLSSIDLLNAAFKIRKIVTEPSLMMNLLLNLNIKFQNSVNVCAIYQKKKTNSMKNILLITCVIVLEYRLFDE